MSCLWFALALACLSAVAEADVDLPDFIRRQLEEHTVIKSSILLSDVNDNNLKLSKGAVSFTNLYVNVVSKTSKRLVFGVTGKVMCNYKSFVKDEVVLPEWISFSPNGKNGYRVTIDLNNCVIKGKYVEKRSLAEINTCKTEAGEFTNPVQRSSEVFTEVNAKLIKALDTAAASLNLSGSGLPGC